MSRSLKKGPFVSISLLEKVRKSNLENTCVSFLFFNLNSSRYLILFDFWI